jgi:hypothetical protein
LPDVEVLGADAGAERRDHGLDFVAAQHLVEAGLLDVQDLALDRQESPGSAGRAPAWPSPPADSPSTM